MLDIVLKIRLFALYSIGQWERPTYYPERLESDVSGVAVADYGFLSGMLWVVICLWLVRIFGGFLGLRADPQPDVRATHVCPTSVQMPLALSGRQSGFVRDCK